MTQPAASPAEVEDYQAKQADEYGRYVATDRIYYDGALAYLPGHPVPASNVEAHGYLAAGLVREVAQAPAEASPDTAASAVSLSRSVSRAQANPTSNQEG